MMMRALLLIPLFALAASGASLVDCKNAYAASLKLAVINDARCKALIELSKCLSANLASMSLADRLSAQGFFDAAQITATCQGYVIPPVTIGTVTADTFSFVKVPADADVTLFRELPSESLSIWDVSDKFDALIANAIDREDFENMQDTVAALESGNTDAMVKIRDEILDIVDTRIDAITSDIKTAMDTTLSTMKTITTAMTSVTMTRVAKIENDIKDISSSISSDILKSVSTENSAIKSTLSTVTSLANSLNTRIANLDVAVATTVNNTIGDVKSNVDKLWAAYGKQAIIDKSLPVFRYAIWSTYSQNHGWFCGDNPAMFGGVNPSTWTDGNGYAYQMSADKNILRTLFNRKMTPGWNANVQANEWYYYSSTNGQVAGALFRIRNTQAVAITWRTFFYFSSYSGWGEMASVALNGANQWTYSGTCGFCSINVDLSMPASRVSTAIFIATSGGPSTTRTNLLVFYNDCLKLPAGLEYVDDLDYATGGWEA